MTRTIEINGATYEVETDGVSRVFKILKDGTRKPVMTGCAAWWKVQRAIKGE